MEILEKINEEKILENFIEQLQINLGSYNPFVIQMKEPDSFHQSFFKLLIHDLANEYNSIICQMNEFIVNNSLQT